MSIRATILAGLAAVACALAPAAYANRGLSDDQRIWLSAHNEERAEFGVPPLEWDPRLARDAFLWAHRLAEEGQLRHSSLDERRGRGENLWMGTAGYYRPEQMIGFFADEKQHFQSGRFPNVSRTGNWSDVGHYTQIVWAETRRVGCARATGAQFDVLVCRYWPAGNVMGTHIAPQTRVARR